MSFTSVTLKLEMRIECRLSMSDLDLEVLQKILQVAGLSVSADLKRSYLQMPSGKPTIELNSSVTLYSRYCTPTS